LGLLLKTTRTPFNTKAAFLLCFSKKKEGILYIHTSSIERREKERLAKEKASSSSRSDFEEEEE
jgi:hypothetical protein